VLAASIIREIALVIEAASTAQQPRRQPSSYANFAHIDILWDIKQHGDRAECLLFILMAIVG
jgi:hypothetical protein